MLRTSNINRVTFSVNVFGTSALPTVRCIIGDTPGFSFSASKLEHDTYEALVNLPKDLKSGSYAFRIEVLLNGRLFTPINHTIDVSNDVTEQPEQPTVAPIPVPIVPQVDEIKTVKKKGLMQDLEQAASRPPVKSVTEQKSVKISIAEIEAQASINDPVKKKTVKLERIQETIPSTIPVSLTRGAVIYR